MNKPMVEWKCVKYPGAPFWHVVNGFEELDNEIRAMCGALLTCEQDNAVTVSVRYSTADMCPNCAPFAVGKHVQSRP